MKGLVNPWEYDLVIRAQVQKDAIFHACCKALQKFSASGKEITTSCANPEQRCW